MLRRVAYFISASLYCVVVLYFYAIRLPELSALILWSTPSAFLFTMALGGMISLYFSPPKSYIYMFRRYALLTMVRIMLVLTVSRLLILIDILLSVLVGNRNNKTKSRP